MRSAASRSSSAARVALALTLATTAALALATPRAASARNAVVSKRFRFEERKGVLTISGGFRELFDKALRRRLRSGFATTVVMRTYLYRQRGGGRPLAVRVRTIRAVYDLWKRRFILRFEDRRGKRYATFVVDRDVVDHLTSYWRFPLVPMASIARGVNYFVAAIVEVNPMSAAVLAEVRRWLRRPSSGRAVGADSFFGSFVSIFVNNKVRRSERTWKVRSQPFFRR